MMHSQNICEDCITTTEDVILCVLEISEGEQRQRNRVSETVMTENFPK